MDALKILTNFYLNVSKICPSLPLQMKEMMYYLALPLRNEDFVTNITCYN